MPQQRAQAAYTRQALGSGAPLPDAAAWTLQAQRIPWQRALAAGLGQSHASVHMHAGALLSISAAAVMGCPWAHSGAELWLRTSCALTCNNSHVPC